MSNVSTDSEQKQSLAITYKHILVNNQPNGIHAVKFKNVTPEALKELVAYQSVLIKDVPAADVIRQLHDYRIGLPPISLAIREIRQLVAVPEFAKRNYRIALIYPRRQQALMQPLTTLFRMAQIRNIKTRAFPEQDYDAAIAWLLTS